LNKLTFRIGATKPEVSILIFDSNFLIFEKFCDKFWVINCEKISWRKKVVHFIQKSLSQNWSTNIGIQVEHWERLPTGALHWLINAHDVFLLNFSSKIPKSKEKKNFTNNSAPVL
jgi:hypothetical protein